MGGSQRLTRAIGKAKAMDLILTGRNMDAEEAERAGVVPADRCSTRRTPSRRRSRMRCRLPRMAKEAVNRAESTLAEGLPTSVALPFGVRHRRQDRRHDRVHREAPPELRTPVLVQTHTAETTEETSARETAERPWWLRHHTFTGTAVGLLFLVFLTSPLPSQLLEFVSGAAGATGYGPGVFAVWLVRPRGPRDTSPPAPRWVDHTAAIGVIARS
jgi:hypothetical protein